MKSYVVSYALDYSHVVSIGLRANTADEAQLEAQRLFDAGDIWDDTPACPLLFDDYVEKDDNVLEFEAIEVDGWPQPDSSVTFHKRREIALEACRKLVAMLRRRQQGAPLGIDALDDLLELALQGTGQSLEPEGPCHQERIAQAGEA